MALSGTITLSSASTNMSTFDLYSCTSSSNSSCSGTAFGTNITRNELLGGFISNSIPDGTTYIKINPNIDGCLNQYIIVELSGVPVVSQTPTPTQTQTPTQTPTPTTNDTTVYYWYALGDCQNMRYTYTQVTNTGMGIITIPGLCGLPSAMDYSDPAHTAYYFDESNPCGFGEDYAGVYNARSTTQLTEGDVYTINDTCYSIIQLNSEPPTWTINMDGRTKETGTNPCFDCQPPFTGFTYYTYSGITCDDDEIIVYDISPYVLNSISPQIGQLYLYHEYDVNGTLVNPGNSCVEITGYIGEFVGPKVVVPLPGAIEGSTYSVPVGPILTGGGEITDCSECIPHWNITTVRCDGDLYDLIGYPIFSTTKPAINSAIKTNANDGLCRKVTDVYPLKFIPYLGGFIGSMHPQIYYVSSSYIDCSTCTAPSDTYYCQEPDGDCLEQLGPCTGTQTDCSS